MYVTHLGVSTFTQVWKFGKRAAGAPQIKPNFKPTARMVTPNNRLVGAVVVSQTRRKFIKCSEAASIFATQRGNTHVNKFSGDQLGKCLSQTTSDAPFGYDPTFLSSSKLYNGKYIPKTFYKAVSEFHSGNHPFAFFPHKYDADAVDVDKNGEISAAEDAAPQRFDSSYSVSAPNFSDSRAVYPKKKAGATVAGEEDTFKLFFDERLSRAQALDMITFAKDGKFIDEQTDAVQVQFVTYNIIYDLFAFNKVSFSWLPGGKIEFGSDHGSVTLSPAPVISYLLVGLVTVGLLINMSTEGAEMNRAFHKYQALNYFCDAFNVIDILHLALTSTTVIFFIAMQVRLRAFTMPENFPVLFFGPQYDNTTVRGQSTTISNPSRARVFRTDTQQEFIFLSFLEKLQGVEGETKIFTLIAGISFVLFIFRILKSIELSRKSA